MNCFITNELTDIINSLLDAQKKPQDYGTGVLLTHTEVNFLETIYEFPDVRVSDLAQKLDITKGAVTQMVSKMESKGLLETYKQEGNKKEKYFRLTQLGKDSRMGHLEFHRNANESLCSYICSLKEGEADVIFNFLVQLKKCVPFCEFTCKNVKPEHRERVKVNE